MRIPTQLLRETITIEDFTGNGAHGPLYGAPRTTRAAVQASGRLTVDSRGHEVVVDVLALLRPEAGPVAVESVVTWQSTRYRVHQALAMPDTRRPSHWELQLVRYAG